MHEIFTRYRKALITGSGVVLFLIAGALTMTLTPSRDEPPPSPPQEPAPSVQTQQAPPEPEPESPKVWYVYVTGAVKKPGVYTLSEDSRIFQAVEAAGGLTSKADDTSLNLAEILADGAHVHVATKGERRAAITPPVPNTVPPAPSQSYNTSITVQPQKTSRTQTSKQNSSGAVMVDVNHASLQELQGLNGVGPAIAQRILEYRQSHGRFNSPDDLIKVRGIGPAKLNKMRSQILIR